MHMSKNHCSYKVALAQIRDSKKSMAARLERREPAAETPADRPAPTVISSSATTRPSYRDACLGVATAVSLASQSEVEQPMSAPVRRGEKSKPKRRPKPKTSQLQSRVIDNLSEADSIPALSSETEPTERPRRSRRERSSLIERFIEMMKDTLSMKCDLENRIKIIIDFIWKELKIYLQQYLTVDKLVKLIGVYNYD